MNSLILLTTMSESVKERSSISSDGGDAEAVTDDIELKDQRLLFVFTYLNIVYGTTLQAFKNGFLFYFRSINSKFESSF